MIKQSFAPESAAATTPAGRTPMRARWLRPWSSGLDLVVGLWLTVLVVAALGAACDAPHTLYWPAGVLYLLLTGGLLGAGRAFPRRLGWANRITLLRAVLVVVLAAQTLFPVFLTAHPYQFLGLALTALALDGADGWIARRTRTMSAFGARFDMELDAAFILVLCAAVIVLDRTGYWVLAIGLARYAFIAAGRVWPWLRRPLPVSRWRKTVCVWQGATLLVVLWPPVDGDPAVFALALALLLLAQSFARDGLWLYRHRAARPRSVRDARSGANLRCLRS